MNEALKPGNTGSIRWTVATSCEVDVCMVKGADSDMIQLLEAYWQRPRKRHQPPQQLSWMQTRLS